MKQSSWSNMDGHRDYHNKWSKSERQIPYDITYMWNLKCDTNKPKYETETKSRTQKTDGWLPRGRRGEVGQEWEFEISRCKLIYTEWINNKVLLYRTGNYIQHPMINYNGKDMKKNICICITESLYCTEIYIALQINYIWIKLKKDSLD